MADYYCRNGLAVLVHTNRCRGTLQRRCFKKYDIKNPKQQNYPHISAVCYCTLCLECIHKQKEAVKDSNPEWKGWVVKCMLCQREKAWNLRKLIPNLALASMLENTTLLLDNIPREEGEDSDATVDWNY